MDLLRSLFQFISTALGWALGAALSLLFTSISIAQFVNHSRESGWFFLFLAAAALLPGAFIAYHRMRKRVRELESAPPPASGGPSAQAVVASGGATVGDVINPQVLRSRGRAVTRGPDPRRTGDERMTDWRGKSWECGECGAPVEFVIEAGYEFNGWVARPTCEHRVGGRDNHGLVADEVLSPEDYAAGTFYE